MTINTIAGWDSLIARLDVELASKRAEESQGERELQDAQQAVIASQAKLRVIDPKLIGEPRSITTNKIKAIALEIFYVLKKTLYRYFGNLNSQIRSYHQKVVLRNAASSNLVQFKAEARALQEQYSHAVEQRRQLQENLENAQERADQLSLAAFEFDVAFTAEDFLPAPAVKVYRVACAAVDVAGAAVDKVKGVYNWAKSLFGGAEEPDQQAPEVELDLGDDVVHVETPRSGYSTDTEDSHVTNESELTGPELVEARRVQHIEQFKRSLESHAELFGFNDVCAQALVNNFFPVIQTVELDQEKLAQGKLFYNLTFTQASKMPAELWGQRAEFIAEKNLTIEFDTNQRLFIFHEDKFKAQGRLGTFALMNLWAEADEVYLRGKPLSGPAYYLSRNNPKITLASDDFLKLFAAYSFRAL